VRPKEKCFHAVLLIALISGIILELSSSLSAPSKRAVDVPALKTPLRTSGAIAGKQAGTSHGVSPGIAGFYGQTRTSFEVKIADCGFGIAERAEIAD
jgi:hypothetical protein